MRIPAEKLKVKTDRKKIVLDQGGQLKYAEVTKVFRLLGSRFFQDLQGSKVTKTKVYDAHLTECDSEPAFAASQELESGVSHPASSTEALTFLTALDDPDLEGEFIEAMIAQNDEDAQAVQQFEHELEETKPDIESSRSRDATMNNSFIAQADHSAPGLSEASWEVLEDEEILAQSLRQAIQQRQKQAAMTGMPTSRPSQAAAASSSPPTTSGLSDPVNQAVQIEQTPTTTKTPLPPALAWGTKVINWGKKHKGRHMYSNVRIEDPGYVQWLIQRFGSLIPEQKDYVSYVRAMTTWDQQGLLNLREILP
ncbi:CCHC-type domain-containing protein [Durusdinium trenchii]|uniref:CCHC-type domain-containing protein n=1 Tax=Durusdinium trenchii TaxID=1381693 RepID=A0ABP0PKA4_9DINO